MGFLATVDEMRDAAVTRPADLARAALGRLDQLVAQLEKLNLAEVPVIPAGLRAQIEGELAGVLSDGVAVPESPVRALDLVFTGQALVLRGLYPEYQDEFDED